MTLFAHFADATEIIFQDTSLVNVQLGRFSTEDDSIVQVETETRASLTKRHSVNLVTCHPLCPVRKSSKQKKSRDITIEKQETLPGDTLHFLRKLPNHSHLNKRTKQTIIQTISYYER